MARIPTPVGSAPAAADTPADETALEPVDADAGAETAEPVDLGEVVEVRVLRDHLDYVANTVALVPVSQVDDSWADADEAAVAYARSLEA